MLFGYGAAVLAGFLLTATPSWSGRPPLSGIGLGVLALIWLAGRFASSAGGVFPALAGAVDLAFLPALAIAITPALQTAPPRNRVFLPLLGVLLLANLGVHLDALDMLPGLGAIALRVTLDLFALLIALIGGRVVPAFTGNAIAARGEAQPLRTFSGRDRLAIGALVLMLLADFLDSMRATGVIALAAAVLNAWRLHGWGAAARCESRSSGCCISDISGWQSAWPGRDWSTSAGSCRPRMRCTGSRSGRSAP
jgi:uncharacterized protein involved in response to NO